MGSGMDYEATESKYGLEEEILTKRRRFFKGILALMVWEEKFM